MAGWTRVRAGVVEEEEVDGELLWLDEHVAAVGSGEGHD